MTQLREWKFDGYDGARYACTWHGTQSARYVALLCHGYGEHVGRYHHVAEFLVAHGAAVYAADHVGHGKSDGERVLIADYERVVDDFRLLTQRAGDEHAGLPVVLVGHSMGGMIAARYAQRFGSDLAALMLSGPVLGSWQEATSLLQYDPIPETPIDVATLSRDPEVGEAYTADPLVWHGPFKRTTLQALERCLQTINAGPSLAALPTFWAHGGDDQLVPLPATQNGVYRIKGEDFAERIYPNARHEIFNETNRAEVLGDVTAFIDRALHDGA